MFNPKKWNVFCWLFLLLWLLPSVFGNLPYEPEFSDHTSIELPNGGTAIAYDRSYLIGCPFTYLEIAKSQNTPPTKTYYPSYLIFNLIFVALTLFGIIYSVQTFIPKFSIRTLFIATGCIALLFPVGNLVFASENYYLQIGFLMSIYFAPLVAMLVAFFYSRFKHRKQPTV